jgi:hypothetical protein
VVCTPASAGSMRLSPKASSLITFFMGSQRGSEATGYQPVMYAPSYGPDAPPVALITVWSTLPSTVAVRTSGKSPRARRKESMKVSVRSPSAGTTQPSSVTSSVAYRSARSAWPPYSVASSAASWSPASACPPAFSPESSIAGSWSPAMLSGRTRATLPQPSARALPRPARRAGWPPLTG